MRRIDIPDLARVDEVFTYDPDEGKLRWAADRPPAVKAGMLAGSVTNADTLTVMLDGTRYAAHHICWYLATRNWPVGRLTFADGDGQNLKLSNLQPVEKTYSQTPQARYARKAAQVMRDYREARSIAASMVTESRGVRYVKATEIWEVFGLDDPRVIYGRAKTLQEAETIKAGASRVARFLAEHPFDPRKGDEHIPAGRQYYSPKYIEIDKILAYDPDTGHFYDRGHAIPRPVEYALPTSGRIIVQMWTRYFPAAMLAWFLTHRRWPKAKSIIYRDGDRTNLRLANLKETKR